MLPEEEIFKEIASRELSRRKLLPFIQRLHDGYQAGWVHEELTERLQVFADDIIAGKSPRLMIMMPPRLGKSLIASQYFPAWFLGRYPDKEIISCSYALSLQLAFSRKIRSLLGSDSYRAVFPKAELSADMQSAEGWRTTAGGGFKPAGRGGPINGFGCHLLVIDDLIKNATEAYSDSTRESAWEWYVSTARTRLAPGGGILTIGTRWHYDDPMGRMEEGSQDGDVFEVIRYSAIATHDEPRRKRGEALHPERYNVEDLKKIQAAVGPAVWEALYQQNPTPDVGGYFEDSWFRYYDEPPDNLRTFMAWDLAIGKKERNDWTVGIVAGVDLYGDLFILDMVRDKLDSMGIVEAIIAKHEEHYTFLCGIERGQLSMAILPVLNAAISERKVYTLAVKELTPGRADKESRARALQGRLRQGRVYFPSNSDWMPDLRSEFLQFPNSRHDDIVDSCAYIAHMLEEVPPKRLEEPKTEPEWLKRLAKSLAEDQLTYMSA